MKLAVAAAVLLAAGSASAGKTESVGQRTYWDRLMESQSARGVYRGSILLGEKRYEEAVKHLANAAIQNPSDPMVHQLLGVAYYWTGRVDQAEAEFRESLRLNAKDAQTHVLMGIVHAWNGRVEPAYESFTRAAELDPKRGDIQMNLGSIEETLERYSDALTHFRRAVALEPKHPLYHYQLGMLYRELGRDAEAVSALRTAIKLFDGYQDAILELGAIYDRTGETKLAFEMFEKAVRLKARDAVARYRMARSALLLGKPDKAREALRGVFHLTPSDRGSGLALSVSYGGKSKKETGGPSRGSPAKDSPPKDSNDPLDVLERNLARVPLDQEAELAVDMAFVPRPGLERKGVMEAPSTLKAAFERHASAPKPAVSASRHSFTMSARDPGGRRAEIGRIMKELRAALDAAPKDTETRLGMNLKFSDRAAEAGPGERPKVSYQPRDVGNDMGLWVIGTSWMRLVADALAADAGKTPDESLWWVVSGIGYSTLGRAEDAAASFERALALDPRNEFAQLGRGVALVIQGDENGAAEAYRKALEIDPGNTTAAEGLKWLLREPAADEGRGG